ncbi:SUMF1/EgtB/PvdO family nonheme iron enzyme [bacterium]|nr:SUMF1/EgtB/PvdO family nonheme iron enzyme [bacterium]
MIDDLSPVDLLQIEAICTKYEQELRNGILPNLRACVDTAGDRLKAALTRELILIDVEHRQRSRQPVRRSVYAELFPEFPEIVAQSVPDYLCQEPIEVFLEGVHIGNYQIQHLLGAGGFATVYLALDTRSRTLRALKVLNSGAEADPEWKREFLREAGILRRIDHPGVVKVFDLGELPAGQPFLAMEYVKGVTLADAAACELRTIGWAVRLIADCAEAVSSVHHAGLTHRDLKPANIIIRPDDRPCLIDFGLALQVVRRHRHAGERAGTLAYMAPEQLQGETGWVGNHTDVWALGVILYELLTGQRPFAGDSVAELSEAIRSSSLRPLNQCLPCEFPPELQQAVEAALVCHPAARTAQARLLAAELKEILAQHPELDDATNHRGETVVSRERELSASAGLWRSTGSLPGFLTWWRLRQGTHCAAWTPDENRMMAAAQRRSLTLLGMLVLSIALTGAIGWWWAATSHAERVAEAIRGLDDVSFEEFESYAQARASLLDDTALKSYSGSPPLTRHGRTCLEMLRLPQEAILTGSLCSAVLSADDDDAGQLWRLVRHRFSPEHVKRAVTYLNQELLTYPVTPPQIADLLPEPEKEVADRIEASGGRVTSLFAFCQTLDGNLLEETCQKMAEAGFVPVRCRPYAVGDGRDFAVAVVWRRGQAACQLQRGLTFDSLHNVAGHWQQEGIVPLDVSAVAPWDGQREQVAYCLTGVVQADSPHTFELLASPGLAENQASISSFAERGLFPVSVAVNGRRADPENVALLFHRVPETTQAFLQLQEITPDYLTDLHGLVELTVSPLQTAVSLSQQLAQQESLARSMLAVNADDFAATFVLGRALAFQQRDDEAIEILSTLIDRYRKPEALEFKSYALPLRALCLARTGDRTGAGRDLEALENFLMERRTRRQWREAYLACLRAQGEVFAGHTATGIAALESLALDRDLEIEGRFYATAGLSAVAGFLREHDSDTASQCLAQSQTLLRRLIDEGVVSSARVYQTQELGAVREIPEFAGWLRQRLHPVQYAAIWHSTNTFTARESHGYPPERHLRDCDAFIADGYRPVSISATVPGPDEQPVMASVWHRSRWTPERQSNTERRVRAAAALLSLQPNDRLWKLLQPYDDPTFATALLHSLRRFQVPLDPVVTALRSVESPELQRQLLLAAGEYPTEDSSAHAPDNFIDTVRTIRRSSPAAGVQSAAEWLLKHLSEEVESLQPSTQSLQSLQHQEAYVTSGGMVMVAVRPHAPFLLGAPDTDADRNIVEPRYRVRELDAWLISTREITVRDLESVGMAAADDEEALAARATWYEAAEFCNRLSQLEGIPEDQQYYRPNADGEYKAGMVARPVSLKLAGYRLPTEREWEFSCRAGADTPWSVGSSPEFLDHYAWFLREEHRQPLPAGLLRPNALGCFDMAGNLAEWCHEVWRNDPREPLPSLDESIDPDAERVIRGGSFTMTTRQCRSAARLPIVPNRRVSYGFRVVRVLPPLAEVSRQKD